MGVRYLAAHPYAEDALNLPVRDVGSAVPYYEKLFAFTLESRTDTPQRRAVLARDAIRIGLAENGGDPAQEGCFFEVDDVEAAFAELRANGLTDPKPNYRVDRHGDTEFKVFFVVAPDGLCYCIGQRQ